MLHDARSSAKIADFSSTGIYVMKRLMVDYDTPMQYLNFFQTNFWYSSSFNII